MKNIASDERVQSLSVKRFTVHAAEEEWLKLCQCIWREFISFSAVHLKLPAETLPFLNDSVFQAIP